MSTLSNIRDALEARSSRVSFRAKLAVVWVLIFIVLAVIFAAFQFNTAFMLEWLPFLLAGVPLTILISVLGILLAVPLALLGALGRLSNNPMFNGVSGFYVSFIRGTPLIVQIFFIYLGLPQLAQYAPGPLQNLFILGTVTSGVLALGINYGAYMAEIFRAGIQSVGTRAGRGGAGPRDDAGADDAPNSAPPGRKGHHPADGQRVHRHDQGLLAGRHRRHPGTLFPGLEDRAPVLPEPGDAGGGGDHLLDPHEHLLLLPGTPGAETVKATSGRAVVRMGTDAHLR